MRSPSIFGPKRKRRSTTIDGPRSSDVAMSTGSDGRDSLDQQLTRC